MREIIVLSTYSKRESMDAVETLIRNQKEMGRVVAIKFLFKHESDIEKKKRSNMINQKRKDMEQLQKAILNVREQISLDIPLILQLREVMEEAEVRIIQLQQELEVLLRYDIIIYTTKNIIRVPFSIDLKKDCNKIQYLLSLCGMATNDWLKRIKIAQCLGITYQVTKHQVAKKQILKIS